MWVTLSCLTLGDPSDCSPLFSSLRGILQARILEWVAISFSRGSSWLRNPTQVTHIAGSFFTIWAIRKAQQWPNYLIWKTSMSFICLFSKREFRSHYPLIIDPSILSFPICFNCWTPENMFNFSFYLL